jgi:aminoglycoside phosphotransferase (APT) family kinase protein
MFELTAENAADYLRNHGLLAAGVDARAEVLAWGVSNQVLRIRPNRGADLVVKQSRERLRTLADWFSRLERIYREVEVMRTIGNLLPVGVVPAVLFEVRDDYLFGMEAVPSEHVVWKGELLAGRFDENVAGLLGDYLAIVHRKTAGDDRLRHMWSDRTVFDELRVDPFYRRIAAVHPEIAPAIDRLIDETLGDGRCAVLADFSPKNVLIVDGRISLVDFETGHYGDPAFDLGFFLSHILLKAVLHAQRQNEVLHLARTFWARYRHQLNEERHAAALDGADLERRTVSNLAACMLARIDGKSPVDYLSSCEQQSIVREFTVRSLLSPPANVEQMIERLERSLNG